MNTNLYSLWENRLIDHQKANIRQFAKEYDTVGADKVKEWQSDDILKWMFESYEVSERLKARANSNPNMSEGDYQAELPVIKLRLQQAGIRLADLLNSIFEKVPPLIGLMMALEKMLTR